MANYYITTTLPYVNAKPHVGFALEIIRADMLARYHRMIGDEVIFNTGTDEHGQKIHDNAKEAGVSTQEFVDTNAQTFVDLQEPLNLSVTNFIRTTNPDHKKAAQEFWKRCYDNGDIYKKEYAVKYCGGCELEKTDSELVNGQCPLHPGREIEFKEEENYFFRFSKYQQALLELYQENPNFVYPQSRMKEITSFVERGLQDFSISRLKEKMPWGVPVPHDKDHVMYVWFDALVNYISTLGWPDDSYRAFWPGTQIAGKDNLRQQSAMWQAMLLSAGLPPSKQIIINGFLTVDGQKMSKSLDNVVDPLEVVEQYGADALRYYLLRHVSTTDDGDFSWQRFERAYNGELANDLGNLVQRLSAMILRYQDGIIGDMQQSEHDEGLYHEAVQNFKFDQAIEIGWNLISGVNQYLEETKPWEISKEVNSKDHLQQVLASAVNSLLQAVRLLEPALPDTAAKVKAVFNSGVVQRLDQPLFPKKYLYTPEPSRN